MLVPDFVDDLARGDRRRRNDGEKAKAPLGLDSGASVFETPAVVTREPLRKIQRRVGLEIMPLDAPPQFLAGKRPDGFGRLNIDRLNIVFEVRSLQRKLAMIFHQ